MFYINKLGFFINYDLHTGNGTHWVALFIELKEKLIVFFDSQSGYSKTLKPEIQKFINKVKSQEPGFIDVINKKTTSGMDIDNMTFELKCEL